MKILFVDHYDSFSNNIISFFQNKNFIVDNIIYKKLPKFSQKFVTSYNGVILSPGPGSPKDYPETIQFYSLLPVNMPVLGICLGHQIMLAADGGTIAQVYSNPQHGKQLNINTIIFSHFLKKLQINGSLVLYHSLGFYCSDPIFKKWKNLLEYDQICLMAEHPNKKHLGVQFHPESFASTIGPYLLNRFIKALKK